MQYTLLIQLIKDQEAKRPVVLATRLMSDEQILIYPAENQEESWLVKAASEALKADKSGTVADPEAGPESGLWFLNVFNPPLRLVLVGAVHIAQPLARMAALAGYDVTVVDPRAAFASHDRFPGIALSTGWPDEALGQLAIDGRTAIVTLTHDPKLDDPALTAALHGPAFYIGSLGSKKTHAARLERLRRAGFDETSLARIHGPVGLAIGAKSPAEIAIAILAQITETLRA